MKNCFFSAFPFENSFRPRTGQEHAPNLLYINLSEPVCVSVWGWCGDVGMWVCGDVGGCVSYVHNLLIILFISYITVQQDEVCKKNTKSTIMQWPAIDYMVVKYITVSLASHCLIVSQDIVSSRILIHSAIMLACMASSVLILFL